MAEEVAEEVSEVLDVEEEEEEVAAASVEEVEVEEEEVEVSEGAPEAVVVDLEVFILTLYIYLYINCKPNFQTFFFQLFLSTCNQISQIGVCPGVTTILLRGK